MQTMLDTASRRRRHRRARAAGANDPVAEKKFAGPAMALHLFGLTQLSSSFSMFGAAIVLVLHLALA